MASAKLQLSHWECNLLASYWYVITSQCFKHSIVVYVRVSDRSRAHFLPGNDIPRISTPYPQFVAKCSVSSDTECSLHTSIHELHYNNETKYTVRIFIATYVTGKLLLV